jgi:hypothetical protein
MGSVDEEVRAILELAESLDEKGISSLGAIQGGVAFTLCSPELGVCEFALALDVPYPSSGRLTCASFDVPGLESINKKLSDRCTVARALALLGRRMGLDLEWAEEACSCPCMAIDEEPESSQWEDTDGREDFFDDDCADEEDADVLRDWSARTVRWEAIERAGAERDIAGTLAGSGIDAIVRRQIFDTASAFRRMCNEMGEIYKAGDFNLMADASGPAGIYQWDVSLAGFSPASPLAADLAQAGRLFGLSSVLLRIDFRRGLHPFYPPSVRLVSPRMQGPVLEAVACHPLFAADRWDPVTPAREALLCVKAFLERHARVDLDHRRNRAPSGGGDQPGAYLEAEHLLGRLLALTGATMAREDAVLDRLLDAALPQAGEVAESIAEGPSSATAAAAAKAGVDSKALLPASKKRRGQQRDEEAASVAWNKGVGYGHGTGAEEVWDSAKSEAVQTARDAEACDLLSRLAAEVTTVLCSGDQGDRADLLRALHGGCMVPLLVTELARASFQDMSGR